MSIAFKRPPPSISLVATVGMFLDFDRYNRFVEWERQQAQQVVDLDIVFMAEVVRHVRVPLTMTVAEVLIMDGRFDPADYTLVDVDGCWHHQSIAVQYLTRGDGPTHRVFPQPVRWAR